MCMSFGKITGRKGFLTVMKGHLEENYDGYKKLQKKDKFKPKTIPKEVQPFLAKFTDITPSRMPDRPPPI